MIWVRGIVGGLMTLLGAVWILQGVNVLKGSSMSGEGGYAVAGAVVLLFGLWLLSGLRRFPAARR